jgi:hypothetical protein
MRFRSALAIATALIATSAAAQTAERVNPQTGNYMPQVDPYMRDSPDADGPNPSRLDNRQSRRGSVRVNPALGRIPDAPDARFSTPPVAALPPSTMEGMSLYSAPGQQAAADDPFAKPDWWPQ